MFQTKVVDRIKTHFIFNNIFSAFIVCFLQYLQRQYWHNYLSSFGSQYRPTKICRNTVIQLLIYVKFPQIYWGIFISNFRKIVISNFVIFSYLTTRKFAHLTLRLPMLYMYGAPILDVSKSHTTTHHSR